MTDDDVDLILQAVDKMDNKESYGQDAIYTILNFYMNGERRACLDVKIQEWLTNGEDQAGKDLALREIWEQRMSEDCPDTETDIALADLRRRLGFENPRSEGE